MNTKNIPPNKRQHGDFQNWLNKQLADPKFRQEYKKAQVEHAPIRAILEARKNKGLTQAKLAKKMDTTQSAIARVESNRGNPTISFMQKLADALDMRLDIRFLPQ